MKMIIPITLSAISLAACGYFVYKRCALRNEVTDDFNDNEIQRVQTLSTDKILKWVDSMLSNSEFDDKKFEVNILPNKLSLEAFKGKLAIPAKYLSKCHLIYIEDVQESKIIARKLIICQTISDDLSCIYRDKVFVIPVE